MSDENLEQPHALKHVESRTESTALPASELPAPPGSGTVLAAPQWFIDRMAALKKLPPRTIEEVQTQFEASAKVRAHFDATGEWPKRLLSGTALVQ